MTTARPCQHRPARWLAVRIVAVLTTVAALLEPHGRAGHRLAVAMLTVAGRVAAAVTVGEDLAAGRCVPFRDAMPELAASRERDRQALTGTRS